MFKFPKNTYLRYLLVVMFIFSGMVSTYSQAAMISTERLIHSGNESLSQSELQTALASDELKTQLQEMGVDTEQLEKRIAKLTPEEINQLNAELKDAPAGGVLGVLLTIFIIFIVTDMLCATDIFTFVKCINR